MHVLTRTTTSLSPQNQLRYKIYEEAGTQPPHIVVDSLASRQWAAPFQLPPRVRDAARALASLLRTCKSIHYDLRAHPRLCFLRDRHLEFDEPLVMHNFFRAVPERARHGITHVDLEPRHVQVKRPGRPYSMSSAFQVLIGANPGLIVAALPEVLPRLKQLRIISSWHTARSFGVVPVAQHVIRELIAIPDLRDRVPGRHHHGHYQNTTAMIPKRDDFTFGFVVAVKFESWMDHRDDNANVNKKKRKEVYHKWCVHCFINEFRGTHGPIKKYGGRLRNMLKGVEWCVCTDDHRPFRKEKAQEDDDTDSEDSSESFVIDLEFRRMMMKGYTAGSGKTASGHIWSPRSLLGPGAASSTRLTNFCQSA
ncbi:hypothetical protein PG994_000655 [Apiospora phragmitis]|uniref:Protein kinase domain-containing protein n=1 Tax=Apiospora phragmitis TaxID=2905665 RepID=A0ABR1X6V7_9PEZI